jgi:preprotein translocase subunit SecG
MLNIIINLLLVAHILVCLLIVLAVLMQRPKNEGLGAAFGAGTADSLFGAQTTNVLASITRWLGGLFFGLTLVLSALYARQGREKTDIEQKLQAAPKPVETAPALPSALPDVKLDGVPESPKPALEAPKPAAEAPKPAAEAPKPAAEAPKPAVEAPKPAAEAPKPAAEAPKPAAESEKLSSLTESLLRG